MPGFDERLSTLFRAAFPDVNPKKVSEATRDSVAQWDSVAALTLLSLIEEEFGRQFDLQEAAEWTSYAQIRAVLEKQLRE